MIYKLVTDKLLKCLQDIVGSIQCSIANGNAIPKMTNTQRDALTPIEGQTIYSLTDHTIEFWNGTAWKKVTAT